MATYPVVNTKTGEQKEVVMSIMEWDKWKDDNPDWTRDYSDPSTVPGVGEVGEWKDKLANKHPGWNEILKKSEKSAGVKGRLANRGINVN
jgi:hypothetical protein